jgi:hypothetical protein
MQLMLKASRVGAFQQSRSEFSMNSHGSRDNRVADFVGGTSSDWRSGHGVTSHINRRRFDFADARSDVTTKKNH